MRQQLLLWNDQSVFSGGDSECTEMLRWLYANNFTFLGYEEFVGTRGKAACVPEADLGLARNLTASDRLPIDRGDENIHLHKLPDSATIAAQASLSL